MSILVALIVLVAGLLGTFYHWRQVKKRGEPGNFIAYFFLNDTRGSTATATAFVASMETLYIAGTFDMVRIDAFVEAFNNGVIYSPMMSAVALAFTAGYMCDSKLNSPGAATSAPPELPVVSAATEQQVLPLQPQP